LPEPVGSKGEQNVPDEFVRWMLWESAGSPLNIRRVIDYLSQRGETQTKRMRADLGFAPGVGIEPGLRAEAEWARGLYARRG